MNNEDVLLNTEVHEVTQLNNISKFTLSYLDRVFEINQVTKTLVTLTKERVPDEVIATKLSRQFNYSFTEEEITAIKTRLISNLASAPNSQLDSIKFKIPLLRPDWVQTITKPLVILYNKYLFIIIEVFFLISVIYTLPGFFKSSSIRHLTDNFDAITFLKANIIVLAIVLFHELGHATACRKFSVKNGVIGFGVYFFTPVFYSDTTAAWKLKNSQRLLIDFGGIYFQSILLIPMSYYYYITKDVLIGYLIFLNYIIIVSNLNPLLKYDGYWIVSDLFNISNMRQKTTQLFTSFARSIFLGGGIRNDSLSSLSKNIRIFIITYTIIANAFFIYFFGWLLPGIMVNLFKQLTNDLHSIYMAIGTPASFLYRQNINILFTILLKSVILFSLARVIYSMAIKIFSFFKSIYHERSTSRSGMSIEVR